MSSNVLCLLFAVFPDQPVLIKQELTASLTIFAYTKSLGAPKIRSRFLQPSRESRCILSSITLL